MTQFSNQYTIYYHDDLDGVSSAAVMLYFFRRRGGDVKEFIPVEYIPEMKTRWATWPFQRPAVILDFRYHPNAKWWFDHHEDPFLNEKWKVKFINKAKGGKHYWDKNAASCCSMIISYLGRQFNIQFPKYLHDLGAAVEIVDGAKYSSPADALDMGKPIKKLARTLDINDTKKSEYQNWLIEILSTQPFTEAAELKMVQGRFLIAKKIQEEILEYYQSHLIRDGKTTFIDIQKRGLGKKHYTAYSIYPEMLYSVSIDHAGTGYHIGVGVNPWLRKKAFLNIGELMRCYGGGGHIFVGGTEVENHGEALRIANEIVRYLNKNG